MVNIPIVFSGFLTSKQLVGLGISEASTVSICWKPGWGPALAELRISMIPAIPGCEEWMGFVQMGRVYPWSVCWETYHNCLTLTVIRKGAERSMFELNSLIVWLIMVDCSKFILNPSWSNASLWQTLLYNLCVLSLSSRKSWEKPGMTCWWRPGVLIVQGSRCHHCTKLQMTQLRRKIESEPNLPDFGGFKMLMFPKKFPEQQVQLHPVASTFPEENFASSRWGPHKQDLHLFGT